MKKKVAVIIPFYRNTISAYEAIALQQCEKVLGAYPKIAIKPQSLVLPKKVDSFDFADVVSFDDEYFNGIKGYNALMLSDTFYKAFLDYDYILIYQLDAFVFKDELSYWCGLDYDYIGAPWLRRKEYASKVKETAYAFKFYLHSRFNITKNGLPTEEQFYNRVGNGGLSLRRVQKFYELSIKLKAKADQYLSRNEHVFNEDAFWGVEVNRKRSVLNIPPYKIAVKFAVELEPVRAFQINEQQLPFGCHAWDLHLDFWRPIFKQHGYVI